MLDLQQTEGSADTQRMGAMTTETATYVCFHVFNNTRPILLVSRAGGDWQCLCGGGHEVGETPKVVGLNHLLQRDPTLLELVNLPDEWEAERASVSGPWLRKRSG
jgi:hypothetical protein